MTHDALPLEGAVDEVLAAANGLREATVSERMRDAFNRLAAHPEANRARSLLAPRLAEIASPIGAGLVTVWLGAGVEGGADPDPLIPHLLAALKRWTSTVATGPEGEAIGEPDERTLQGLEWLGQGIVAHLSRSREIARYRDDESLAAELDRVRSLSVGCQWVWELLSKESALLIVLEVAAGRGFRVRYENLSNCFHLFTLLQAALAPVLPGRKRVAKSLLEAAAGMSMEDVHDAAWWHYGRGDVPEADFAAMIWGEQPPSAIPRVDGEAVMLLWPPVLKERSWDGNFFRPYLMAAPPAVTLLGELSPEEVRGWRVRLKLPEAVEPTLPVKKPWWRRWGG